MIKISGGSDDLVEVEGCEGADEFNVYGPGELVWRADLTTAAEALRVYAIYDGNWSFAVGQADEDLPLPSWPVRITQHPDIAYSVLLEIDAPDGARLTNVWPERSDDGG